MGGASATIVEYTSRASAERLSISLPLYAGMTEDETAQVVEALQAEFDATAPAVRG